MTNASESHRKCRLLAPALAINFTDPRPSLITVPVGSVLEVANAPLFRARFVEAWWGKCVLYVLRTDLEASLAQTACASSP
jgi:hypothetical protein